MPEQDVSEGDEYIDYFKYLVKWSPVPDYIIQENDIRPLNNYMCAEEKEMERLVMPLCGTRPFSEKMREELCELDENGKLTLKKDIERPAFLRYNSSRILDQFGQPSGEPDLFDLLTTPTDVIHKVDAANTPSVMRARAREAKDLTAGPNWSYFPKTPNLRQRPELRKDLKILTHRAVWDPHQRYKNIGWERKGTNTKSPNRISYPKFLQEGYVVVDKKDDSQNLPRKLRYKSLTTQVLADPAIRKRLHERFRKKQEQAGGWRMRKGEEPLTDIKNRPQKENKPPKKVRKDASLAQLLDNHELANARKMMQLGFEDPSAPDTLAKRKMPIMPFMGGTGKTPTSEDIYNEARKRAGKRVRKSKRPRHRDPDRAIKKRVMGKN